MPDLKLFLLGAPRITLAEQPLELPRRKVMALLAYLAVTRRRHSRDRLATLLWPESSQKAARGALRRELHALTTLLGDTLFNNTTEMVELHAEAAIWVDTLTFQHLAQRGADHDHAIDTACDQCQAALVQALALYTDDFLAGFTLPDATDFDEWQRFEAEGLRRAFAGLLAKLIHWQREQGEYAQAITYARRWLALDTMQESVHRELIELYALAGEEAAALRQYNECVQILDQELGAPPAAETVALAEAIRGRRFPQTPHPRQRPPTTPSRPTRSVVLPQPLIPLVGRQTEWRNLQDAWTIAQQRGVHCVVITGEAGIGKTRLAEEMAVWAQQQEIATAQTRAYAAQGELAYAAVVALLRTAPLQRHIHTRDSVCLSHLSRLLPELRETYPTLPQPEPVMDSWQRQQLFAALAQLYSAASEPFLLIFDDLQWADRETLEWLHYLIATLSQRADRDSTPLRLLLVGTLRTGEVGVDHLVYRLLRGLQRDEHLTQIDLTPLDKADAATLAGEVATRPLTPTLLARLQQQTAGNPLYIVESVRTALLPTVPEATGAYHKGGEAPTNQIATSRLSPLIGDESEATEQAKQTQAQLGEPITALPPKVYAVIQARLQQLSAQAQELTALAAVIGRAFSLDLLTLATQLPEEALALAVDELWEHQIIREQGDERYDFSHDRIRDVAYSQIGPGRRRLLHRYVAEALEKVQAERLAEVSSELARHYAQAGLYKRALAYYAQAAGAAQQIGACTEAIALLQHGIALLPKLPDTIERKAQELTFLLQLSALQRTVFGYAAAAHGQTLARARILCHELNKQEALHHLLMGLYTHYFGRGAIHESKSIAEELLTLANERQDLMALEEAHHAMGSHLFALGNFPAAHDHFQRGIAAYDPQRHTQHVAHFGFNLGCFSRAFDTHVLWMLGEREKAAQQMRATIEHARALGHPFTLALVLAYSAMLHQFGGEPATVVATTTEALALCHKHGITYYEVWCTLLHTWAVASQSGDPAGPATMQQALARFRATESGVRLPYYLSLFAELHLQHHQLEEGLAVLTEAEQLAVDQGESWWLAKIYQLRGEIDHRIGCLSRRDE
ncbi:MAG: AAA family ATPase [Caldilineaceae bacterium]